MIDFRIAANGGKADNSANPVQPASIKVDHGSHDRAFRPAFFPQHGEGISERSRVSVARR